MDRAALKKYAPQARRDFIAAIADRAGFYGLTKTHIEPVKIEGDVALIGGRPFDRNVAIKRIGLERRFEREGFDVVIEAIAYTWFNRFVAIRYMELHGYLDHGYRVLSHPEGKATPEIIEHAQRVALPGLSPQRVIDLKIAGDKEGELYRLLLVAQCNALHAAMPFLFERIDDETELLLPENLLHSDSLIRKLVREIPEESWQKIEVIGWIYQFYISEKKDEVIGKVVKSEDIPAATQLFTPNWIVKYLVQNSIGRQWLATYPESSLRQQMEYYIEPAEQTPEVQAQLKAITPKTLNPAEMTLLDPACGSGHILVEAYDLFMAIYQERGYRAKDIPRLILRNNLFGVEIDDRAAQLACFAVLMKARADDRRIFEGGIRLNVRCIQSSDGLKAEEIYEALTGVDVVDKSGLPPAEEFVFSEEESTPLLAHMRKEATTASSGKRHESSFTLSDIRTLLALFKGEDSKTFGSLIRVPEALAKNLPEIRERTDQLGHGDDLGRRSVAERFTPIAEQAWLLGKRYDAVVANPPYMGGKAMNAVLKAFAQKYYPEGKSDLFAMFILRGSELAAPAGLNAMITMQSWMFISSFEDLRAVLHNSKSLVCMAHLGSRAFDSIGGEVVQTTAFALRNVSLSAYRGNFMRLIDGRNEAEKVAQLRESIASPNCGWLYRAAAEDFKKIPGSPIAYWASEVLRDQFQRWPALSSHGLTRLGMTTANNDLFTRFWYEIGQGSFVASARTSDEVRAAGTIWVPYNKGGAFRKWYGNMDTVLNWKNDGYAIKHFGEESGRIRSTVPNTEYYFRECITWSKVSSGKLAMRYRPQGSIFDVAGACVFAPHEKLMLIMAMTNSAAAVLFLETLSPTLNFEGGQISSLPIPDTETLNEVSKAVVPEMIKIAKEDWDSFETSWDFRNSPLMQGTIRADSVQGAFANWYRHCTANINLMRKLEEKSNCLFIDAYGLHHELSPEVPEEQITLARADREQDIQALISYAIGCMMGRYSLNEPGLIYAHRANEGFDPSRYASFPADPDGIIPLTECDWFTNDATNRFVEFVGLAWPKEPLQKNLDFVAESLGPKRGEDARDTICRYVASGFYRDHLQTYKRRPIYWLFTSGKERAFQCLVYLHRYHAGTLARMRTEYVIPLQGKMAARMSHLENDIAAASSTAHRSKLEKERTSLKKQLEELRRFDEKLRHYADQRIAIDLDDGVKVNYAKFGDLLAEVKAVAGGKSEEE